MSKKNRNKRRNSPLAAHKRHRSKLTPPLLNITGDSFRAVHWELDDQPDFLIVCHYLIGRARKDVDRFHFILDLIDNMLGTGDPTSAAAEAMARNAADEAGDSQPVENTETAPEPAEPETTPGTDAPTEGDPATASENTAPAADVHVFTGRLTDFEDLDESQRTDLLAALLREGLYEELLPEELAHALGMYPDAPGAWLLGPWRDRGLTIDPSIAERTLNRILVEAGPRQGDIATWTKALICRRYIAAGRAHLPSKAMWEHFTGWPNHPDEEENRAAEAGYRAMYGAMVNLQESVAERRRDWAKSFWRANWKIYTCRWPDETLAADLAAADLEDTTDESQHPPTEPHSETKDEQDPLDPAGYWRKTLTQARKVVEELRTDFQHLAETTDPDLYDPDRYEVLTGLVGRVLRYLGVFAGYPPLWTMEHGAPLLRTLIETRIVFRYIEQSDDSEIFGKFKAYGMGKLKLLKLHYEDVIDKAEDPPAELVAYVEYLDALVNQDIMEEFQGIDLGGNFAGADTRKMAIAVGLEDAYRLVFSPASANVHGEWSIMDEYVFDRCENPAHHRHRILRRSRDSAVGPNFLQTLIDHAAILVEEYETATEDQRKIR